MSAQPFVMTHAGGVRTIASYTVPKYTVAFARRAERSAGTSPAVRVWGDGGALPAPLEVQVAVEGGAGALWTFDSTTTTFDSTVATFDEAWTYVTLAGSYAEAYAIIAEAETALLVTTHMGEHLVNGLLGYDLRPDGAHALLALRFARRVAG